MTTLTPALPFIAQIVGAGAAAGGQLAAGEQQQQIGAFNAAAARASGAQAVQAADANVDMLDQQLRERQGAATAAYGASGVQMSGSPLAVMASLAAKARLTELSARYQGTATQAADETAARLSEAEGAAARRAGTTRAIGTLLTGAGQFVATYPGTAPNRIGGTG